MSDERYAPPQAAVTDIELPLDPNAPRKRTAWIWVICVYHWVSSAAGLGSLLWILTTHNALASEMRVLYAQLSVPNWILMGAVFFTGITASIQLFRLRGSAVFWFAGSLVLQIVSAVIWPSLGASAGAQIASSVPALLVMSLIIWYTWRLRKKGLLR